MQIIALGINHKTASLETREKVAFAEKHKAEAYADLACGGPVGQCVILSTCNRTEIYALVSEAEAGRAALIAMLEKVRGATYAEIENCLYYYCGPEAVAHLFRVTAGLDSMIIGETQILGQVKEAYEQAVQLGAVGKELHGLFQQGVKCAKKVQTDTKINHNSVSVSYVAVEMLRKELGSFAGMRVLVIGAGKMSRLTLKHLHALGVQDIWVTSRTHKRAQVLAGQFDGKTVDFSRKEETMPAIDIIISSTGAPHLLLLKSDMEQVMARRNNKPVFIIDIAVPRDIDPEISELKNIFLYDMDSLQQVVAGNQQEREKEASAARNMIALEVEEFQAWFKTFKVVPVIRALRYKADQIRHAETVKYMDAKLSRLSEKEKLAVENLTKSVVNAILKEPIIRMKSNARRDHNEDYINSLLHLFDLYQAADCSDTVRKRQEVR
ncbi:MAG: glutamyl-tRNA reductase [Dethiobacteria bacterium]|nr:glutamyl-tRNA reductase [Dethiobacteria bacterium]